MKTFSLLAVLALTLGFSTACATSVPQLRYQAQSREAMGDWAGMLKIYDEVLVKAPEDWEAHAGRGRALLHLGKPQQAETALRLALGMVGHEAPVADSLCDDIARAKVAQKDVVGLPPFLAEEVKRHGTTRDFVRQGTGLSAIGDLDGALRAFRKAEIRAWDETTERRYAVYLAIADFYGSMRDQPNEVRYVRYAAYLNHAKPEIEARLSRLGRVSGPTEWVPAPTKEELLKTEKDVVETK